ncbi:MAG: signal transduction histidine kinase, partial [Cognaticolwellia sp.]
MEKARTTLSQRRIWNSVVLGSALLLVLFAAFVVLAVFGSTKQHNRLAEHLEWGQALHYELALVQLSPTPASSEPLILLSDRIEKGSNNPDVMAAAVGLRSAAVDSESSRAGHVALAKAGTALDHALDQRATDLTATLNNRGNALQAISISSVAMALALVGLLLVLRRRILSAEAMGMRLETALAQVHAVRDMEKAANNAKADFLATVSHEIRTPLTAILGSAELLDAQELSQAQAERVGVIRAGGETLLNLIDAVLDLSRIETSAMELHPRPYAPIALLEETLLLFAQSAADKGLELSMWASAELPAVLKGDPDRTRQVAVNLMGNAIKFTQEGEVHLRAEWTAAGLCIEVHDTGSGIDERDHNRIMESFTQLKGSRHADYGGVGLGLTIALRILRAMGGFLELDSTVGQGSIFRAHMPHTALEPPICFPTPSPIVVAGKSRSAARLVEQLQAWGATAKLIP